MPVRRKMKSKYPKAKVRNRTEPKRKVSTKKADLPSKKGRPETRADEKYWKQDRSFYFFKIQNGEYRLVHKDTGKVFFVTASKTNHSHHVEEEVLKRGRVSRELVRYFRMRTITSVQKCADKLSELIEQGTLHRLRRIKRPMKLGVPPAPPAFRKNPTEIKTLKFKAVENGSIVKVQETGELFLLEQGPDGWTIYFTDEKGAVLRNKQPICWDESDRDDALIELQIYLSEVENVVNAEFGEQDIAIIANMYEGHWILDTVRAVDGTVLSSSLEYADTLERAIAIEKDYYDRSEVNVIVMVSDEVIRRKNEHHEFYIKYNIRERLNELHARRKARRSNDIPILD